VGPGEEAAEASGERGVFELAFVEGEDVVAGLAEGGAGAAVAAAVAVELGEPEVAAGGGDSAAGAVVHVPEAAGDEDDFFDAWEDEVGGAGEGFDVEAEAEAEGVDEAADEEFGVVFLDLADGL
jgi:hypothetical protein